MSEHISDLRWDQLIAGDLAPDAADVARAHAKTCAACNARFAEIEASARTFDIPMRSSRLPRWSIAAAAAVAIAAATILLVRARNEPDTRTKGHGAQLALLGGPSLAPLASGDPIKPGDRLQAIYSANRDGFGAVLAIDRTATPSAYVPSSGTSMVALPAGTQLSYPESTIADATTGDDVVVVLWCETAHPLPPLLEQLRARNVVAPPGCTKLEVTIKK